MHRIPLLALVVGISLACLLDAGCRKKAVRPQRGDLPRGSLPQVSLPTGVSETDVQPSTLVTVTRQAVHVGQRRVCDIEDLQEESGSSPTSLRISVRAKRDGPDGFFIDPLFEATKPPRQPKVEPGRPRPPRALRIAGLRVDPAVPYRTLAEVMNTLSLAEHDGMQLILQRHGGGTGAIPVRTPRICGDRTEAYAPIPIRITEVYVSICLGALAGLDARRPRADDAVLRTIRRSVQGRPPRAAGRKRRDGEMKSLHELMDESMFGGTEEVDSNSGSPIEMDAPQAIIGPAPGPGGSKGPSGPGLRPPAPAAPALADHLSLTCLQDLGVRIDAGDREVALRFRVGPQGAVTHLATRGSTPEIDAGCVARWARSWKIEPGTVPAGDYGLVFTTGKVPSRRTGPWPPAEALVPIETLDSVSAKAERAASTDLTLVITARGLYLKASSGAECPARTDGSADERLCFPNQRPGRLEAGTLIALQRHLHDLVSFYRRYRVTDQFNHSIIVVPEPEVSHGDLVRVLGAIREIPGAVPGRRCRARLERYREDLNVKVPRCGHVVIPAQDPAACLFQDITLSLGSS